MIKNKLIIFDFLRTVYDPDKKTFLEDALSVLKKLKNEGNILILYTSKEGDKNRKEVLDENNLEKYFDEIYITEKKNSETMNSIKEKYAKAVEDVFVIGDRVESEIFFGNENNFQTIWLKKGKYRNNCPENKKEKPNFLIYGLKELLKFNFLKQ